MFSKVTVSRQLIPLMDGAIRADDSLKRRSNGMCIERQYAWNLISGDIQSLACLPRRCTTFYI